MPGDQSSQFFSAILMAAPYARDGVEIAVEGDLVSKPYMTMTAAVMADFGVRAELDTHLWKTFRVAPGQRYAGRGYAIEPDASNASYFFAAAAVTGAGSGSRAGRRRRRATSGSSTRWRGWGRPSRSVRGRSRWSGHRAVGCAGSTST
jgi:5-enolpyruvylshikimate-3-phosphate synthase